MELLETIPKMKLSPEEIETAERAARRISRHLQSFVSSSGATILVRKVLTRSFVKYPS